MIEIEATIQNEAGIHCRPTAVITQEVAGYEATVTVVCANGSSLVGSALDLLMLGLEHGTTIALQVEGPDEEATAKKAKALFETNFDFPNAGMGG